MPVKPLQRLIFAPSVLGVALLVVGLTACSRASASSSPPPTAAPATTAAPPATAAPATTAAPVTTPPDAPVSAAPTTTLGLEAQIEADFRASFDAYYACAADPAPCDVSTIATPGSPLYERFESWIQSMARDDIRARPGADAYIVVEDIKVAPGHRKATLRACFWDTGVIYDRRGTDDPSDDVIFDDVPIAMRSTYELDLTDKGWLRSSNHDTTKQPWENLCGPAPA